MWAGCYLLDLYCDKVGGAGTFNVQKGGDIFDTAGHMHGEFPHQYTGESGHALRRKAREAGWIIKKDGTAICPKCSGKVKSSNVDVTGPRLRGSAGTEGYASEDNQ